MNSLDRTMAVIVRATGGFQIVVGVLFWIGFLRQLVPLHMLVGLIFVVALWILAARALRAARGFAAFVLVWGVFVLVFGMIQRGLLTGPAHWVIDVLHLLVGAAAMGFGDMLAKRMRMRAAAGAPPAGAA